MSVRGHRTAERDAIRAFKSGTISLSFGSAWRRARLTAEDRVARGRSARRLAPRSSHRRFEPAADRPDPISPRGAGREPRPGTRADPLRTHAGFAAHVLSWRRDHHGRRPRADSPFGRHGPTLRRRPLVELRAVRHAGAPNAVRHQRLRRDASGPWEWDLKRLAASFEVHGRDRGFTPADRRAIVLAGVSEYRRRMRRAAKQRTLDSWYDHLEAGQLIDRVRQEARGQF